MLLSLAENAAQYPGAVNSSEVDYPALRAEVPYVDPTRAPGEINNPLTDAQAMRYSNYSVDEKRVEVVKQAGLMAEQEQDAQATPEQRAAWAKDKGAQEEDLAIRVTNILNDRRLVETLVPGSSGTSTMAEAISLFEEMRAELGISPAYEDAAFYDAIRGIPLAPGEYTPELVAGALGLTDAFGGGTSGGSGGWRGYSSGGRSSSRYYKRSGRYYSSRSYGRGGGGSSGRRGGGGGGSLLMGEGTVPPAKVSMPRLNSFDRSLYPGNGEVPTYYAQRYPRDWMSAGQKLRPDKLSKWRAPT